LDKFLKENLDKGYIKQSQSPMASLFFFVKKKDGKLRPCQDYQYLNDWTVKNAYPLLLISEIIDKIEGAKFFTKFDVQWGYCYVSSPILDAASRTWVSFYFYFLHVSLNILLYVSPFVSPSVSHVVLLPACFHPIVSFNDIHTPVYLVSYI
jgi:hypothetical protein